MEVGGGGLATMGWRTEEAGVWQLVERVFSCPRSMNGETEGGGELRGDNVLVVGNYCPDSGPCSLSARCPKV